MGIATGTAAATIDEAWRVSRGVKVLARTVDRAWRNSSKLQAHSSRAKTRAHVPIALAVQASQRRTGTPMWSRARRDDVSNGGRHHVRPR